jgi:phosphate transport system substrate-binding protein
MAEELDYVSMPDSVKAMIRKEWAEIKDTTGKAVAVK